MTKEQQDELYRKYPKIFAQRKLSIQQSAMPWGFDCSSGWFALLDTLCERIQHHIDYKIKNKEEIEQLEATQVKEKFGGLRFYYTGGDEVCGNYIDFAEDISYRICEECGTTKDAKPNNDGWIVTLCPECRKKREEKYDA